MMIILFRNARSTDPTLLSVDWDWMCDTLPLFMALTPDRSAKLEHQAMMFGKCDGPRAKANVEFLSGLAADFDLSSDDPRYLPFDAMCDRLESQGLAFIAYTTTANDDGNNRYRLLMPYARDVPFDRCQPAWFACNAKFDGAIDASTKDESRLSFLPGDWQENPFADPRKGQVTLTAPFNAVRVNRTGKPILTEAEIDALTIAPVGAPATPSVPRRASEVNIRLSPDDVARLACGNASDAPFWRLWSDFDRSPLVTHSLRSPPTESCDRVWRFAVAVACRAVRSQIPISVECLTALTHAFEVQCLKRVPSQAAEHERARRAHDALAFALRNAVQSVAVSAGEC